MRTPARKPAPRPRKPLVETRLLQGDPGAQIASAAPRRREAHFSGVRWRQPQQRHNRLSAEEGPFVRRLHRNGIGRLRLRWPNGHAVHAAHELPSFSCWTISALDMPRSTASAEVIRPKSSTASYMSLILAMPKVWRIYYTFDLSKACNPEMAAGLAARALRRPTRWAGVLTSPCSRCRTRRWAWRRSRRGSAVPSRPA